MMMLMMITMIIMMIAMIRAFMVIPRDLIMSILMMMRNLIA